VIFRWFSDSSLAFDLPKLIALPPPTCSWRMNTRNRTTSTIMGSQVISTCCQKPPSASRASSYWIFDLFSFSMIVSPR
jgi:hypothetical protein